MMNDTGLSEYFSCGFFLIKADKPDWIQLQTELFPAKLLSLSECICPHFAIYWGWDPPAPEKRKEAAAFGISEAQWDEFLLWCRHAFQGEIEYPSVFSNLTAAQNFAKRFNLNADEIYLVEVGLHHALAQPDAHTHPDQEAHGVPNRIAQRLPMLAGGTPLGFEVTSFTYNDFGDSWLCSPIPQEIVKLYGIRPGQLGLIQSEEDARKVYKWVAEDEPERQHGEPEPYHYYLLVQHPLYPSPDNIK